MTKPKPDMISEKDFTMLNVPKRKKVYPAAKDVLPKDENSDPYEETLMGMEYDVESNDEINDTLEDTDKEERSKDEP